MPPSAVLPAAAGGLPPVRAVPVTRAFAWIARGWRDVWAAPLPALLHGLLVALGGWAIAVAGHAFPWMVPGAFSGFVLVAPILVTGLYELSRRLEAGQGAGIADVVAAWRRGTRPLVRLGLLLLVAGSAWVALSALLFRLFVHVPIDSVRSFLRYAVLGQGDWLFLLWTLLGGLGAALMFAATAVAAPLMLDREIGFSRAMLTSVRAIGDNPIASALWAGLIMLATLASIATAMAGFVLAVPVLGCAAWHAYRELVDASGLPPRA